MRLIATVKKKSVTKNYIYNLVYQILVIVLPLITTPYISGVLGAEKIGIYSFTTSIATYFILFGSLGVAMYAQREIAYVQNDEHKRSKLFWEIFFFRCITMAISIIVFYFTYASHGEYQLYYKILIIQLFANVLDISWFFQGLEEFKKTVTRNLLVKIVSVIAIFIFVKRQDDLWIYFVIFVLSTLLGNISLWLYLPKYVQKIKGEKLQIFSHLKPTIGLFIPQIAIDVYTLLDRTMLGYLTSDMSQVGNYEQSQKIIKLSYTLITALGTVMTPRIASMLSDNNNEKVKEYLSKSINFVLFLGVPLTLGVMAVAKTLVPWFLGDEFSLSIYILMAGSLLIIAKGFTDVAGVQYLIPSRNQGEFTKSVIAGAIINVVLNFILIPIFGAIGAIIASVIAEVTIAVIQYYYLKKKIHIHIFNKSYLKYIISGLLMFAVVYIMGVFMEPTFITTILQICVGGVIYIGMLLILKDEFLYERLEKILQIFKLKMGSKNEK